MAGGHDPERHLLDPATSRTIFDLVIAGGRFAGLTGAERPTMHFFGGQPGSGKSASQQQVIDALRLQSGPDAIAVIIGDELRGYHPNYDQLLSDDDAKAAFYTDRDSARWVQMSIDHATSIKSHVVLEGTLRNPDITLATARRAIERGYTTELHVMAVHEYVSRARILRRYAAQISDAGHGRYTIRAAHDRAYDVLPESLQTIVESNLLEAITLDDANSEGICRVETDTSSGSETLLAALAAQREDASVDAETLLTALDEIAPVLVATGRTVPLEELRELRTQLRDLP